MYVLICAHAVRSLDLLISAIVHSILSEDNKTDKHATYMYI